jgi:hypothetical protein
LASPAVVFAAVSATEGFADQLREAAPLLASQLAEMLVKVLVEIELRSYHAMYIHHGL